MRGFCISGLAIRLYIYLSLAMSDESEALLVFVMGTGIGIAWVHWAVFVACISLAGCIDMIMD